VCSDALSDVLKSVVKLQNVSNHPQLVEPVDVRSPFHMDAVDYHIARLVHFMTDPSKRYVSTLPYVTRPILTEIHAQCLG